MIDNTNPTTQFHPYQPETSTPQTGHNRPGAASQSGIRGVLGRLGIDQSRWNALGGSMRNMNVDKVRGMARSNGGMVLGGLAALAIGAGLLRRRSSIR